VLSVDILIKSFEGLVLTSWLFLSPFTRREASSFDISCLQSPGGKTAGETGVRTIEGRKMNKKKEI
jgi:hypothetical protein